MAGRIPDAFLHDLLARTDIVELIGARVELKRAGKEFKGRSPFTNEKTPSFFVSPQKQMFFDFSSGKSGTAITFLMEYDRLGFPEAVEELARRAGVEVPREGGNEPRVVVDGPLDALAAAQRFFTERLRHAPTAIEYLKKRGVSGETAKRYGIGYAPDSWDALTQFLQNQRHALDAGLLIEREGSSGVYDRFRNRVMFPIRDTRGRVIAFGGRTLANDPAKYLNSPETVLFHKGRNLYGLYEARSASTAALPYLIVVEGYMDVVMLAQYGVREVVGTLGTATTREHLQLIFKSTAKVVFCFDGDRAGRAAAWRALEQVLPEMADGRECVFMFLPEGQDPDTYVQQIGAEAFRQEVERAQPLSQFLLDALLKQANVGSLEGRAKLLSLAKPHLQRLRAGTLRTLLIDELGRRMRLSREDIEASLGSETPAAAAAPAPAGKTPEQLPVSAKPVRRALQLLLEKPELADRVGNVELLLQSELPGLEFLLEVVDFFQLHPGARAAQLLSFLGEGKKADAISRVLASDLNDPQLGPTLAAKTSDEAVEREFLDVLNYLNDQALAARRRQLQAKAQDGSLSEPEAREWRALAERTRGSGKSPR
ncbi:DNA primase [Solimonas aquatica]|uniref:DNA primase n=1 Tax=Solimonas aquatica TaxID=489703 RepID=A0A1H9EUH5_9GAMM|nr:DNA primase [Solimonas aquatica]SEQ29289.1 DNA primase [Solimonas aquatica]